MQRRRMAGLIGTLLVTARLGLAQEPEVPVWTADCAFGGERVRFSFRSKTGDVENDDMRVLVTWHPGRTDTVTVEPAWFKPLRAATQVHSACRNIGGFHLTGSQYLIALRFDGRPGWDHISLVLLDARRHAILEVLTDLGELCAEPPVIRSRRGQLEFRLSTGQEMKDGGEACVPAWRGVSVTGGRLHTNWDSAGRPPN